ncbi:hypothetical protein AB4254_09020 [Vibrio breoganii]
MVMIESYIIDCRDVPYYLSAIKKVATDEPGWFEASAPELVVNLLRGSVQPEISYYSVSDMLPLYEFISVCLGRYNETDERIRKIDRDGEFYIDILDSPKMALAEELMLFEFLVLDGDVPILREHYADLDRFEKLYRKGMFETTTGLRLNVFEDLESQVQISKVKKEDALNGWEALRDTFQTNVRRLSDYERKYDSSSAQKHASP